MFKWFWTIFSLGAPVVHGCFLGHHFCTRCLKGFYNGSPVHFVLFCQLLALNRYGSSSVGKEITCKWQNQRLETNKYVPWALFLKLQTAEINFEKLLGWTVFKIPNFNLFQSCSVLSISGSCCICCVILTCFKWLFLCFFL